MHVDEAAGLRALVSLGHERIGYVSELGEFVRADRAASALRLGRLERGCPGGA